MAIWFDDYKRMFWTDHTMVRSVSVQEHRYDTCGSDSPEMRYEMKTGTDLGEAVFDLLVYKFAWQANQARKKEKKK